MRARISGCELLDHNDLMLFIVFTQTAQKQVHPSPEVHLKLGLDRMNVRLKRKLFPTWITKAFSKTTGPARYIVSLSIPLVKYSTKQLPQVRRRETYVSWSNLAELVLTTYRMQDGLPLLGICKSTHGRILGRHGFKICPHVSWKDFEGMTKGIPNCQDKRIPFHTISQGCDPRRCKTKRWVMLV